LRTMQIQRKDRYRAEESTGGDGMPRTPSGGAAR